MSNTFLKIKIMSLAAEAKIIRREEKRWPWGDDDARPTRASLYFHRTWDVRNEARAALLAYGYLRGRAYAQLEYKCHEPPNWHRVMQIVAKFGPDKDVSMLRTAVQAWRDTPIEEKVAA